MQLLLSDSPASVSGALMILAVAAATEVGKLPERAIFHHSKVPVRWLPLLAMLVSAASFLVYDQWVRQPFQACKGDLMRRSNSEPRSSGHPSWWLRL